MQYAKPAETPMIQNDCLSDENKKKINFPYREAVGSLLYISSKTRPDIAYAVSFCSRKMENPTRNDVNNVKRIMRYLKDTKADGIVYRKTTQLEIAAYSDSDFAGDETTRKSTTGYVVYYCNGPVTWCSRKQPVVALSSTEAEFIAAAECVKELLYIKVLIEHLTSNNLKVILNIDNQSAIAIIKNGMKGATCVYQRTDITAEAQDALYRSFITDKSVISDISVLT
ncbi:secreted RxLR effector protein 161-like [Harmonia axyridis]|uniref:secreted RxLR effector protein 161-like n=1 Tax=Harmonia axyridis TaxID=115357 RepID=UPI001E27885C|nr:secreted RxLR effector protein 161-like [Harmonia axyridis]